MYDEPFDQDIDPESYNEMSMVMTVALRLILSEKSQDEFLDWAQSSIPVLAPLMFENFAKEDQPKMAYWMGVNLWSSAPHPNNHYKPLHVEKPARNAACPCGSGKKYKQCCSHLPPLEQLSVDTFWFLMPEVLPKTQINSLIKNNLLPVRAISIIAGYYDEEMDHTQIIKMLDPLFAGNAPKINHNQSGLLDLLCDSYNAHYKSEKKKKDLLERMCQHKDRTIRAEAWQRIATWKLDTGDFKAAMNALSKAMQAEPENPSHSLLELTLLVSDNQIDQAKQRAGFWRRKLKHYEFELPELINTLERAQLDPAGALQKSLSHVDDDPRLLQLLEWIEENANLPMVEYHVEKIHPDDNQEEQPEFEDDPMQNAATLQAPANIIEIERKWAYIKPIDKPFSSQLEPMDGNDIWENTFDREWIEFLQENPQAINSLDILDDLVTLIYIHPNNDNIWGPLGKIQPLLDRNFSILQCLNTADKKNRSPLTLPWLIPDNRPPLRLLVHNINLAINQDKHKYSIEQIKCYLQLNPEDNHGYRSLLINHYLRENQNEKAIELATNYPDDMLAETRYGKVLALYRLGDLDAAEQALQSALDTLPLVAEYLIKARVAQPKLNDYGISYGGKDQAWFYRDEMRETWKQAEGGLAWLKKQIGS